ncbi:SMI1/KNR4 family protein [Paractinoplanes lichenicola]|uniref:SMI1/KNR4 family protein n=1 Tax=Paractinoplanes lichenicola TaxID=2802976 RepID=A0ABS1VN02_9ACTN|nr:SMI1/KNR4 family protein [Actinoplanes lichenicola]MBL7256118.1 SMI1/KNR4 family protein [Actinoplanes lichenicola]
MVTPRKANPAVTEIDAALHRLGRAFVAGLRQPGYQLATVHSHGSQSQTYTLAGEPALLGRWNNLDLNHAEEALRGVAAGRLVLEMIGDPDGTYTIHWSRDVPSLPARIVLDEEFRLPGHERPPARQPGVAGTRGTDPAVLAEVGRLVGEFTARHHPRGYAPGHAEEQIVAAERELGVRLPEDLRALYRLVGDDRDESGLLDPFVLAPLHVVVEWNRQNHPGYQDGPFDDAVIFDCVPAGHVRRVSSSSGWVTFARDYGMNFAAVDLDPGPRGRAGQVVTHGRDVWAPVAYVAASITDLLRRAITTLGDERPSPPDPEIRVDRLRDLPLTAQGVVLRTDARIRPADLAPFTSLRSMVVRGKAKLTLPPGLPLEHLDVQAARWDLTALPPTIVDLVLSGNAEPAPIAGLATLPGLVRLDLSGATVPDIGVIATLPALKVLTLSGRQWTELLATGWRPAGLAAAGLGGSAGVGDAARWFRALGREGRVRTLTSG